MGSTLLLEACSTKQLHLADLSRRFSIILLLNIDLKNAHEFVHTCGDKQAKLTDDTEVVDFGHELLAESTHACLPFQVPNFQQPVLRG